MATATSTATAANGAKGAKGLFAAVARPFRALLGMQAASGVVLFASAAAALVWANVHPQTYRGVFELDLTVGAGLVTGHFTLRELINDLLMSIFFFVVGMEIKRELVTGALNTTARALLPGIAAIGGMVAPALIFYAFNQTGPGRPGWGIPMATDIAFCVGVLTLLGSRVPRTLVVFITALAIFDDIGGILVIAIFYGHGISTAWLLGAAGLLLLLVLVARAGVVNGLAFLGIGVGLWFALHHGGIHATLSGVLVGLAIPVRPKRPAREVLHELAGHTATLDRKPADEELEAEEILAIEEKLEDLESPVRRFVHMWHPWVAWLVMPVFALANSGVQVTGFTPAALLSPLALGVSLGLLLGKPLGIFGATWLAVKLKLAPMPAGTSAYRLFAASVVAGIGFTVALFIAALAFPAEAQLEQAKAGVLVGSALAGVVGAVLIRFAPRLSETKL